MIQQIKDKSWRDESGREVPVEYVTPVARLKERSAAKLLKEALIINKRLVAFKTDIIKLCDEVFEKAMKELNAKDDYKGNFTWFNFDRSIKIEVSVSDRITFDDLTIKACQEKLNEFLSLNIDSKTEFIKDLINDAFSTSKGRLDSKKVMSLLKYQSKISDPLFQEAIGHLNDSIRRPDSKTYYKVWTKDTNGSYEFLDLNFSSI